ncbi:MAG: AroM family protein [Acetobacteraceae bacterium]|nr:AroM family protein [Acetobacteraceae bacterium]
MMPRILVINPNSSRECTAGIDAAVAAYRWSRGPEIDVVGLSDGPPAILSWRDWHAAVEPLCRRVEREAADVYVIACASDPGIEAVRALTARPVLGVFRSAVAACLARAERFGVIAIVQASKGRHLAALRSMGLEGRLAAEVALNVSMDALLDPVACRARLIEAAKACVAAGAGAVVLGCTGMAAHRAAIEAECGVPVIEPCAAAVALGLTCLVREPVLA